VCHCDPPPPPPKKTITGGERGGRKGGGGEIEGVREDNRLQREAR